MSAALIVLCTLAGLSTGVLFGALFTQLRAARRIEALRVDLASAQARVTASQARASIDKVTWLYQGRQERT